MAAMVAGAGIAAAQVADELGLTIEVISGILTDGGEDASII